MREITGETKLLAVIGHPVAHSLSPQIHNRFADALGLPYAYLAFDITPERLAGFIDAARHLPIAGFNLTMPLKEAILPYLSVLDDEARLYGAVNTAVVQDGGLTGYNTDGGGFVLSLQARGFDVARGDALILGVGGAAKAVAIALARTGMAVCMATRRPETLPVIHPSIRYCHWDELEKAAAGAALLVNATPLGMHGTKENFFDFAFLDGLSTGALVYDLIYAPRQTALLAAADERGLQTMNGLPHLLHQAALSFAHFTGEKPTEQSIREMKRGFAEGTWPQP